jgi:hypothetical protein
MFFFWVVTQCGLIDRYQRFGETYGLHLQGWSLRVHTVSDSRRTASAPSPPWEPQISSVCTYFAFVTAMRICHLLCRHVDPVHEHVYKNWREDDGCWFPASDFLSLWARNSVCHIVLLMKYAKQTACVCHHVSCRVTRSKQSNIGRAWACHNSNGYYLSYIIHFTNRKDISSGTASALCIQFGSRSRHR